MVYLPDVIYSLRSELRVILGAAIFMIVMPFVAGFIMSHSALPAMAHTTASLSSGIVRPLPLPPKKTMILSPAPTAIWPVRGIVTLEFGMPDPPYERSHTGIDIAKGIGEPVLACMSGKVMAVGYLTSGYGIYVELDHGNNLTSLYGHLSAVTVTKGQNVAIGDMIGREGRTGWATGPHVHFEVRIRGVPVNPRAYVRGNPAP